MSILIKIDNCGKVSFNGEELLEAPKIYLSDDGRFRTQTILLVRDKEIPLDIVIHEFDIEKPSLMKLMQTDFKLNIKIIGEELKSKTKFNMMITYHQGGKEVPYVFHGTCGNMKIRQSFENLLEVFQYFYCMFK